MPIIDARYYRNGRFFWDQDRKQTLESRLPALEKVVFHAKLGTQAERVERIVGLDRPLQRPDSTAEAGGGQPGFARAGRRGPALPSEQYVSPE